MLWKEFCLENEPDTRTEEDNKHIKSVIKSKNTSLPKSGTSN